MTHDVWETTYFGLVLVVQVLALIAVVVARVRCRSSFCPGAQVVFLVALLAAGGTAMGAVALGGVHWMSAALPLPLMAVGATIDLSNHAIHTS